ncbi:hypothetical protein D9758_015400 [Tetrapyrgos nigripes]|uniref:Uncharacterized protein n=1 Tax=Tetrapyrgos nigripes TaxID=182062 RepID=A0A8H5FN41_9AGAR|nr:hypothetical protein D9758_015400 [Tetrapyrgos nigripes]
MTIRWADKIRPWITGATTDDIVEADPDIVQAYQQRWQLKWNYFSDAAPQEMQKQLETVIEMDTKEMKNRVDWLSKEFERLSISRKINSNLDGARQSLKNAEIVYQFTLQSFTFIVALHRRYRLGNNTRSLLFKVIQSFWNFQHLDTQGNLVTSRQVDETRSSQEHFYPLTPNGNEVPMESMSSAHPMQMPNVSPEFPQPHTSTSHIPQSQNLQIIHHYPPELVTPHGTSSATMLPNINQNQLAQQSVKSSHKTSIAALLTIGFFGASITWSTVFSGTRGNMALISWSASTFITSSVCAASASVLVTSEEEIVEKHSEILKKIVL